MINWDPLEQALVEALDATHSWESRKWKRMRVLAAVRAAYPSDAALREAVLREAASEGQPAQAQDPVLVALGLTRTEQDQLTEATRRLVAAGGTAQHVQALAKIVATAELNARDIVLLGASLRIGLSDFRFMKAPSARESAL